MPRGNVHAEFQLVSLVKVVRPNVRLLDVIGARTSHDQFRQEMWAMSGVVALMISIAWWVW